MASPLYFRGIDAILGAPPNWDAQRDGPCVGLPISCASDGACVSFWRPTPCERLLLAYGGNIVVWVHSGLTQPPIMIATYPAISDAVEVKPAS